MSTETAHNIRSPSTSFDSQRQVVGPQLQERFQRTQCGELVCVFSPLVVKKVSPVVSKCDRLFCLWFSSSIPFIVNPGGCSAWSTLLSASLSDLLIW